MNERKSFLLSRALNHLYYDSQRRMKLYKKGITKVWLKSPGLKVCFMLVKQLEKYLWEETYNRILPVTHRSVLVCHTGPDAFK
jgi:hypothetical protein